MLAAAHELWDVFPADMQFVFALAAMLGMLCVISWMLSTAGFDDGFRDDRPSILRDLERRHRQQRRRQWH